MMMQNNPSERSITLMIKKYFGGDLNWGKLRFLTIGGLAFLLLAAAFMVHGLWRFFIAPLLAIWLAFMVAVRYLRDIYELDSIWQAFHYLFAAFFGIGYPHLSIFGGKKNTKEGEVNLLDVIGGPGIVFVSPGNAVLFEGLSAPAAIYSDGSHFVPRFQRIQPIALEDQYGELEGISAMSRDGFDVKVGRTRFRFRLQAIRDSDRLKNPYPYSEAAIYEMIYNRTVSEEGPGDWSSGVALEIRRVISGYISKNTLDHLTAPEESGADPRGDIQRELRTRAVTESLRQRGTELLWIDIGSFEVKKEVEQQRLNTWQAKWKGDVRLARSYGEATRIAHQEIGRAEAQAEMLISIMHALSDVNLQGGTRQSLRDVVLVRTAQLLEAMGETIPKEVKELPEETKGKGNPQ